MRTVINITILSAVIAGANICTAGNAAEIRLKNEPCLCSGELVLLGDVADVIPNRSNENAEQLRQTVLFPAPRSGEKRVITPMELRNIFARIGIKSVEHQFTGAMKTAVGSSIPGSNVSGSNNVSSGNPFIRQAGYLQPSDAEYKAEHKGFVSSDSAGAVLNTNTLNTNTLNTNTFNTNTAVSQKLTQTLEKQIAEAINVYLDSISQDGNADNTARKITVKLDAEQSHRLATGGKIAEITGGTAPFTGRQNFEIQMSRADAAAQRNVSVKVDADITEVQKILCAARSLPRGHIINKDDLILTAVENRRNGGVDNVFAKDVFTKESEVIGMETVSPVREKSVLSVAVLKRSLWVKKGDIVSVCCLNNGIVVRTAGIAQEDGAENDIVPVNTVDSAAVKNHRQSTKSGQTSFTARVSAPKTVELYAGTAVLKSE